MLAAVVVSGTVTQVLSLFDGRLTVAFVKIADNLGIQILNFLFQRRKSLNSKLKKVSTSVINLNLRIELIQQCFFSELIKNTSFIICKQKSQPKEIELDTPNEMAAPPKKVVREHAIVRRLLKRKFSPRTSDSSAACSPLFELTLQFKYDLLARIHLGRERLGRDVFFDGPLHRRHGIV